MGKEKDRPSWEEHEETPYPAQCLSFDRGYKLYIGSRVHAKNQEVLKRLKVNHIVNVTPDRVRDPAAGCPCFFQKDSAFKYMRFPVFDNSAADIMEMMDECMKFIDSGKYYGSVFVHCNMGASRSAAIVLGYMMKHCGMRLDDALAQCRVHRKQVNPNYTFMTALRKMEAGLLEKGLLNAPAAAAGEQSGDSAGAGAGAAGPSRGPSGPSRGPAGPSRGPSAGPSRGPSSGDSAPDCGPSRGPSAGPSRGPPAAAAAPSGGQEGAGGREEGGGGIGPARGPPAKKAKIN